MTAQATVRSGLLIQSGNLFFNSQPASFTAAVEGSFGPTPGAVEISILGTDIDFSKLPAMGGLCLLTNLDPDNFVTYGLRDLVTNRFAPLGELLPGEFYPLRLSRYLPRELSGTGSGTGSIGECAFHMVADTDNVAVQVQAFAP